MKIYIVSFNDSYGKTANFTPAYFVKREAILRAKKETKLHLGDSTVFNKKTMVAIAFDEFIVVDEMEVK